MPYVKKGIAGNYRNELKHFLFQYSLLRNQTDTDTTNTDTIVDIVFRLMTEAIPPVRAAAQPAVYAGYPSQHCGHHLILPGVDSLLMTGSSMGMRR